VSAAIFLSSCVACVSPLPFGMARDEGLLGRGWRERGGMEGGSLLLPPSLASLIDEAEAVMGEHHKLGFASLRSALEREASLGVSGPAPDRGRHHHHRHNQGSPQEPSATQQAEESLPGGNHSLENLPGAYYRFLPTWAGAAKPGSPAATWSSPCFSSVSATTTTAASPKGTGLQVIIKTSGGGSKACTDSYLLATTRSWHIVRVSKEGTTKQPWSLKTKKRGSTRWESVPKRREGNMPTPTRFPFPGDMLQGLECACIDANLICEHRHRSKPDLLMHVAATTATRRQIWRSMACASSASSGPSQRLSRHSTRRFSSSKAH
jgi:hypothetical protein